MQSIQKKTILITGSEGHLGSFMSVHLPEYLTQEYDFVLTDKVSSLEHTHPFILANISDIDSLRTVFKDHHIDIVVHFAGNVSKETPWEDLLPNNIVGTYNVLEAAREAGCERVVLASSINAVNGYPEGVNDILENEAINPKTLYGAGKAWLEAIAHVYANERNLSCICIRFGRVVNRDDPEISIKNRGENPFPATDRLITFEDATQLTAKCIEAPKDLRYFIAHGVSENDIKRLSIEETKKVLGYSPKDNSFEIGRRNDAKNL